MKMVTTGGSQCYEANETNEKTIKIIKRLMKLIDGKLVSEQIKEEIKKKLLQ